MLDETQRVVHIIYEAFILILSLCMGVGVCGGGGVGGYFKLRGTEPQQIQVFMYYFCFLKGVVSRNVSNSNSESCHHVE